MCTSPDPPAQPDAEDEIVLADGLTDGDIVIFECTAPHRFLVRVVDEWECPSFSGELYEAVFTDTPGEVIFEQLNEQ